VVVFNPDPSASPMAIPDAQVCVLHHSEIQCASTNAGGAFALAEVPSDDDMGFRFTKDSYLAGIRLQSRPTQAVRIDTALPTLDLAAQFSSAAGFTSTAGQGLLELDVVTPNGSGRLAPLDGVTFTTVAAGAQGPVYTSAMGLPDQSLHATTTAGQAFFAGLDPGDVEVRFSHPTKSCKTVIEGWASTSESTVRAPIQAATMTIAIDLCN
jgi:hypothetical protein